MGDEKYIVEIGAEGSIGLGRLDYCFNPTTQEFLLRAGLKQGMKVLDIGCGSGVMTGWIAEQVGSSGKVVGIENDHNQLNAAIKIAENCGNNNVEFKFCSAYDIDKLDLQFDLVYCRFVLHHLHDPEAVIKKIFAILNPKGIYAAEEGIVNFAFSYPFTSVWGDEAQRVPPVWTDPPENQRDGNIGVKMFTKMHSAGFEILCAKIIHPLLTTREEKNLLLLGREEMKNYFLAQGNSEDDWQEEGRSLENLVENDNQIAGFYASCQVAGIKY